MVRAVCLCLVSSCVFVVGLVRSRGNNGDVAGRNTGVLVVVLSRRRQVGVSYIRKCV